MTRRCLSSAVLALLGVAIPVLLSAQVTPQAMSVAPPVLLRPGDILKVQVRNHEEWSGDMPITDQGFVGHVAFSKVRAAGVPLDQIMADFLRIVGEDDTDPVVVIQAMMRVGVGGEVRAGQALTVMPGTTVGEVIVLAGGTTERAALDKVRLIRDGVEYRADLNDLGGDAVAPVRSGDLIIVPVRRSFLRDFFLPVVSVLGSTASLIALFR